MNRMASVALVGALAIGTLAGCSKDHAPAASGGSTVPVSGTHPTTTALPSPPATGDRGAPTSPDGGDASARIKAYCDAVSAYLADLRAAAGDPSKYQAVIERAKQLAARSQEARRGLTPAQDQQLHACLAQAGPGAG